MQIPQSNFFEVTINPQQLWLLIEGLHSRIAAQEQRIAEVSTQAGGLQTFVLDQTKKQYKEVREEIRNFISQSKQNYNETKSSWAERDQKSAKKLAELQSIASTLNYKMQTIKTQLQDDLALKLCYLERKINSFQGAQQKESEKIASRVDSLSQKWNQLQQQYDVSRTVQSELQTKIIKKLALYDQQLLKNKETFEKDLFIQKDKQMRSRNKIKTEKKIKNEDRLEVKLETKTEEAFRINQGGAKNHKEQSNNYEERRPKEMLRLLAQKIQVVSQTINQKLPQMKEKLDRYIVRSEIVNQQVDFLNKKIQKERAQFNVLSQQIRLYQDKKNNQKEMQNIKSCIDQLTKELNDLMQVKLNKEVFERYQKYVNNKLSFLVENFFQKADKNQVKKGLSFLQGRIKEVIILLVEQKNLNNDGALKKVVTKCLSCDKQLELTSDNAKKQLRTSFNLQARASTPHLRKKYKNNLTTMEDQN